MKTLGFALLLVTAFVSSEFLSGRTVAAQDSAPGNLEDAAKEIVKIIGPALQAENQTALKQLVATFPFGNAAGQATRDLGNAPGQLQSHIASELEDFVNANALGTRYGVLDRDELEVATGGVVAVKLGDADATRSALTSKGIAIGILGSLTDNGDGSFNASVELVTQTQQKQFTVMVGAQGVVPQTPGGSSNRNGRFSVNIYAKPKNSANFQKQQLREAVDQSGKYRNVLFLELDRSLYFGQPFEIELRNNGTPKIHSQDPSAPVKDSDRVFGAAVYLDGVSSILRKETQPGGFVWRRDGRHPAYVGKHVLTAANRVFITTTTNTSRFIKSDLQNSVAPGHSVWRIRGFQKGANNAKSFLWGTAADSVAVGMDQNVSQIGLISIHFFAERLDGDIVPVAAPSHGDGGGVTFGPDVPSPTITVGVKDWYPITVEDWHILYCYAGDPSLPPTQPVLP
jgi:hypothetical protein